MFRMIAGFIPDGLQAGVMLNNCVLKGGELSNASVPSASSLMDIPSACFCSDFLSLGKHN